MGSPVTVGSDAAPRLGIGKQFIPAGRRPLCQQMTQEAEREPEALERAEATSRT